MTNTSNSAKMAAGYVERMAAMFTEIAERQEDIKEILIEAKGSGFKPALLRRWALAKAKDKEAKLAAELMEAQAVGEALHPDLFADGGKTDGE